MVAVIMHFIRSFLRKDYLNRDSKTLWLTGILLYLPMIGPSLSDFLIEAFTLPRTLVVHICILPAITLVLMGIHTFSKVMKRAGGLTQYVIEHSPITLPFLLAIAVLAYVLPMPSQDPAIIPMPLEGENLPTAEWFILIFYVPYLYVKGFMATLYGFYIQLIIFLALAIFPYFLRGRKGKSDKPAQQEHHAIEKNSVFAKITLPFRRALGAKIYGKALSFLTVFLVSMAVFGPLFAISHQSPT